MIEVKEPVIFDCRVAALANCFPMIPSGKAHNEMLLGADSQVTGQRVADLEMPEGSLLISVLREGRGFVPRHFEVNLNHPE